MDDRTTATNSSSDRDGTTTNYDPYDDVAEQKEAEYEAACFFVAYVLFIDGERFYFTRTGHLHRRDAHTRVFPYQTGAAAVGECGRREFPVGEV